MWEVWGARSVSLPGDDVNCWENDETTMQNEHNEQNVWKKWNFEKKVYILSILPILWSFLSIIFYSETGCIKLPCIKWRKRIAKHEPHVGKVMEKKISYFYFSLNNYSFIITSQIFVHNNSTFDHPWQLYIYLSKITPHTLIYNVLTLVYPW